MPTLAHPRAPRAPRGPFVFPFFLGRRAPRALLSRFLQKHLGQDTPRAPLRPGATAPLRPGATAPRAPHAPNDKKRPNPTSKRGMDTPEGLRGHQKGAGARSRWTRWIRSGPDFEGRIGAPKNEKRAKDPKDPKDPRKNDPLARPLEKFRNSAQGRQTEFFRFSRIPSFQKLDPLDPNPPFHSWKPPFFGWTPAGP